MEDRKLGRIPPLASFDYGNFRAVVASDGVTRFFPRIVKTYNTAKAAMVLPDGPLGRAAKAMAAIKRMYRNDALGCCVIASRKHKLGILSGNDVGTPVLAQDSEVDLDYHAACGAGDNGCDMSIVNKYEQNVGMMMSGVRHKSDGSVSVDHTNILLCKTCLFVFGTINLGFSLPQAWYDAPDGADWDITNSRIIGGHEVQAFDYDSMGVLISTWGGTRRILWRAWTSTTYGWEMYTSLNPDWYNADNIAPNGINVPDLINALQIAASGQVPPLPGVDPPIPPIPPVPSTGKWDLQTIQRAMAKGGAAIIQRNHVTDAQRTTRGNASYLKSFEGLLELELPKQLPPPVASELDDPPELT